MNHLQRAVETHPAPAHSDGSHVRAAIVATFDCVATCTLCADACLHEPQVSELRDCIRLNLDCADVCDATGRILARCSATEPSMLRAQVEACITACRVCAEQCEKHAQMHQHCAMCAESCRRCEQACSLLVEGISRQ